MPIQCRVSDESPVLKKLEITIENEKVAAAFNAEYKELKKTVRLRGFRPGKVPINLLEKYFGDRVKGDVLISLINQTLEEAVREQNIQMVGVSKITPGEYTKGQDFSFTADVEVRPNLENIDYLGLEVKENEVGVEDLEVDLQIERMRDALAQVRTLEDRNIVERGDVVVADLKVYLDGEKELKDYSRDELDFNIPETGEIEGILAEMVGKKIGDTVESGQEIKEDDSRKELRGHKLLYKATIREIRERILPELDDEFAKDVGEADSLDELKEKIKKDLLESKRNVAKQAMEEMLKRRLVEKNSFEVPDSMIKRRAEDIVQGSLQNLKDQGMDVKDLEAGKEKLLEGVKDKAERDVRAALLLDMIGKKEGIDASDDEVEAKVKEIAEDAGQPVAKIKAWFQQGNGLEELKYRIREEKILAFLLEKANIFKEEGKEGEKNTEVKESGETEAAEKQDSEKGETGATTEQDAEKGETGEDAGKEEEVK
ncbi:MAG: trigger factor [Deltaproteobacteria bacterium]|nr:trigger factor [Deltaproteobacteria bacterium]